MGALEQEEGECSTLAKRQKSAAATDVSMELDFLDCPVCFEPLAPPIFQCFVGHLICSSCCEKLPRPKKCHCSREGIYRCYGVEKIIGSIQVPCPNTKYGCAVKTSYHQKEDHEGTCSYKPCFCPENGCSFAGLTAMLLEHFTTEHHWPSTKFKHGWSFHVKIQDGVRVLFCEDGHLFLLNVSSQLPGSVVSLFCVGHAVEPKFRCLIECCSWKKNAFHRQSSEFLVPSASLVDGIPRDCFMFIVPKFYLEDSKSSLDLKIT